MLKKITALLLAGMSPFPAAAQTALNPPDIYLSVLTKESSLPGLVQQTATVRIGNGFASQPITAPSLLTVTLDYALAEDLVRFGTGWATLSNGTSPCAPVVLPPVVGADVQVQCTIPPLGTGKVVDLTVKMIGQEPWTQSSLNFSLAPVQNEVQLKNQEEQLRVSWIEAADLAISSQIYASADPGEPPLSSAAPGAAMVPLQTIGSQVLHVVSRVQNNGPTAARGARVQITRSLGLSDYVFPAGVTCTEAVLSGTPIYECLLPEDLGPGESFDLSYSVRVNAPDEPGTSSFPSFDNAVSLEEGYRRPVDINSSNNAVTLRFEVTAGTDVSLTKRLPADMTLTASGERFSYAIEPSYIGNSPLRIIIEDELPAGLTFVALRPEGYCDVFSQEGQHVRCEKEVPEGTVSDITSLGVLSLEVEADAFSGASSRQVMNNASVAIDDSLPEAPRDARPANNFASAPVLTIEQPNPELTAHKSRVLFDSSGNPSGGLEGGDKPIEKNYAVVGDRLTYEIMVENTGNVGLTDRVFVTDRIPFGMAYTGFESQDGWSCSPSLAAGADPLPGPLDVRCELIYPQGTKLGLQQSTPPLYIKALVVGGEDDQGVFTRMLLNGAVPGAGPGKDFNYRNGESLVSIEGITRATDLEVRKTRALAEVAPGDWQTYTITALNNGMTADGVSTRFAAEEVRLTDRIDNLYLPFSHADTPVILDAASAAYCSLSPAANGDLYAADLLCSWDSFAYCELGSLTEPCPVITLQTRQGGLPAAGQGQQRNTATIYSELTPEPDYSNNVASVDHAIPSRFDLKIEKTTDLLSKPAAVNTPFNYQIRLTNLSRAEGFDDASAPAAEDVANENFYTGSRGYRLVDSLPEGLRILAIDAPAGVSCTASMSLPAISTSTSTITCIDPVGVARGEVKSVTITAEAPAALFEDLEESATREITRLNKVVIEPEAGDVFEGNHNAESLVKIVDGDYDIAVTKAVDQAFLFSGDFASFTLTVSNVGSARAEAVELVDGLPDPELFEYLSSEILHGTNKGQSCAAPVAGYAEEFGKDRQGLSPVPRGAGMKLVCPLGDLMPEQSFKVRVHGRMLTAGSDRNYASVTASRDRGRPDSALWTDDANYANNWDFTSVTAQEVADLKFDKSLVDAPADNFYNYKDRITFKLAVENISKASGPIYSGEYEDQNALIPYFTDASDVLITDTLPAYLQYTGVMRITGAAADTCEAPVVGAVAFRCEVPMLPNGATIEIELETKVNPDTALNCPSDCTLEDGRQYFTTKNAARVEAKADRETNTPSEGEVELNVLLSSLSGHYWWDLQKNTPDFSGPDLDFNASEGDRYVGSRELILFVADSEAPGGWKRVTSSTTSAGGAYAFNFLPPGTYKVVDALEFNALNVASGTIPYEAGKNLQAILGAVTPGTIPGQDAADFGTAVQSGTGLRGITEIELGEDRHGIDYDLRIIPVPKLNIVKAVDSSKTRLFGNGLYEVHYTIDVTNGSAEPLKDVVLKDPLDTVYTQHSASLQARIDEADLGSIRDLGPGITYAVRPPVITARPAAANAAYRGVSGVNDDLLAASVTLAPGETLRVNQVVLVNLGQLPLSGNTEQTLSFTNIAKASGTGAYTGFVPTDLPEDPLDGGSRKTPDLAKQDDALVQPKLTPAISLVKSLVDRSTLPAMHQGRLVYSFVITNTGTVPLQNITLIDAKLGIDGTDRQADLAKLYTDLNGTTAASAALPQLGLLLAGESVTLYGSYELSADEYTALDTADSLEIVNTATVRGTGQDPAKPVVSPPSSAEAEVGITLTKELVDPPTEVVAGQELTYRITLSNPGVLPYRNALLSDSDLLVSGGTLISGPVDDLSESFDVAAGGNVVFTFSYTVLQSDIDALSSDIDPVNHPLLERVNGGNALVNTASSNGQFGPGPDGPTTGREDEVTYPLTPAPAFTSQKLRHMVAMTGEDSAGNPVAMPGDKLAWAVLVTNSGNSSLRSVTLSDELLGLSDLTWTADAAAWLEPGESILFHDAAFAIASSLPALPTDVVVFDSVVTPMHQLLTAAQIDAGQLTNRAEVSVVPVTGEPPEPQTPTVTHDFTHAPAISLVKAADALVGPLVFGADGVANIDVTYQFTVTNTGNVTLSDISIGDPLLLATGLTGSGPRIAVSDLAPAATVTVAQSFRYSLDPDLPNYAALLAMLNAAAHPALAQIENSATVEGTPPATTANPEPPPVTDTSEAIVEASAEPGLTVTKTGLLVTPSVNPLIPQISWTVTVKNTGAVTLTDITVVDPRAGQTLEVGTLTPQQSWSTVLVLDSTLAERDQGFAENTLTEITGRTPQDDPYEHPDPVVADPVPLPDPAPGIEIDKSDDPEFSVDGSDELSETELTYYFRIRNTGNVSLSELNFEDPLLGVSLIDGVLTVPNTGSIKSVDIDLPDALIPVADVKAQLASDTPDAPLDLTGYDADGWYKIGTLTVVLTLDPLDQGTLTNDAWIEGTPPGLPPVTHDDEVITPLYQNPDFTVVKSHQLTMADETRGTRAGDEVVWSIAITNTGNITLNGITVDETAYLTRYDAAALNGSAWQAADISDAGTAAVVSYAGGVATITGLAPGRTMTLKLRTVLTDALIAEWKLVNVARVSGSHVYPPGHPAGGDWTKTETPEDEVPFTVFAEHKVMKSPSAEASLSCVSAGTPPSLVLPCRIGFAIEVENTGNIALDSLVLTETVAGMRFLSDITAGAADLARGTLNADQTVFTLGATPLAVGETITLYSAFEISDLTDALQLAVLNAGEVTNLVTLTSSTEDPHGGPPVPGDENPDSVPEATGTLDQLPSISLIKTPVILTSTDGSVGSFNGDDLSFEGATTETRIGYQFEITNTGNVTLTDIMLYDERLTGSTDPIGPLGDLDPGESLIWTSDANTLGLPMAVTPDQAELDAGVLPNAARTTGDFGGEEVEAEDEVTVGLVPQAVLRLEKSGTLDAGGDEISYSFAVYNDGQVTLKDVVIRDPLLGTSWSHSFGADVTLAPGADPLIYTLTPAEAYVLLAADRERGWVYNKANANAVPDTDNPLIEPPLPAEAEAITAVPGTPLLQLTKVADDRDLTTPPEIGQRIYYTLTVENIGLVTVQEIDVTDALPGFSFDGSGTLDSLAPGASHDFTGSYPLRQEDLDAGKVINTARVEGAWVPEDLPKDPPPFDTDPPGRTPVEEGSRDPVSGDSETKVDLVMVGEFTATKTADLERVSLGDTVSYTLSFTSQSTGLVRALDIIDMLPKGLIYTPDSAVVTIAGGTPVAMEPVVSGRRLTWSIADIPRLAVVKVSFKVRVSALAPYGKLTNQTWSETPEGERNSNTATATVLREPDHVFECSDVTGKVFDDRNHNGRQDPLDRSALTNDDVYTGKFGKYEDMPKEPQGERGLPGVRLVTPTGTVITTDQHGRYSVPCAELPKDLGTNFTLKLDTRSLPSGYRVTTENPRTLRLTAGKAAEMNFGATLSKLVRLDLSSVAFQGAGAEPSAALDRALRDFAAAPGEGPLVLHLGYHLREGESRDLARKRLDNVEKILVKSWSGRRANLLIERSYTLTGK